MGLAGFKEYQRHLKNGAWHKQFGFQGKAGDVNQLAARMSVAKSLTTVGLADHKEETALAYTALFRAFLSYSAFEVFFRLVHGDGRIRLSLAEPWSLSREPGLVTTLLRQPGRGGKLVTFLVSELDAPIAKALTELAEGKSDNALRLAAALRHIFAHGSLTAHAYGTTPAFIQKIGDATAAHVLRIVDEEFSARVSAFVPKARESKARSTRRGAEDKAAAQP